MSILSLTHVRLILIALALTLSAGVVAASGSHSARLKADPFYCVVIYDGQGHPIDTICVPSP